MELIILAGTIIAAIWLSGLAFVALAVPFGWLARLSEYLARPIHRYYRITNAADLEAAARGLPTNRFGEAALPDFDGGPAFLTTNELGFKVVASNCEFVCHSGGSTNAFDSYNHVGDHSKAEALRERVWAHVADALGAPAPRWRQYTE